MAGPKPPPSPATPHDAVRNPPSADSLKLGTTVAVIAHVGLIAALTYGVAWKRQEVTTISAELWSAVPQQAAPAAPPPPPTPTPAPVPPAPAVKPPPPPPAPKVIEPPPPPAPREADIARERADKRRREAEEAEKQEKLAKLEQAKRDKAEKAEKAEKEKLARKEAELKEKEKEKEAERKAAEKADKAKEAAQQEKAAKAREDNLKRLQKQLGEGSDDAAPARPAPSPGGTGGNAAQSSGPSAGYAGRLRAYLKPKLVYTGRNIGSTPAVVRVRVAPDGTIISRELIKSSGQADWDQAVLDAIDRAGVVPRDTDNRVPPVIDIPWTASER